MQHRTIVVKRLRHLLPGATLLCWALPAVAAVPVQPDEELREIVVIGERINSQAEATEQTEKLNEVPGTFGEPLRWVWQVHPERIAAPYGERARF